ncbi:hypothetical protein Q1695_013475 [Nippostrongylus brasiliensis]|nr:hypothetical protein Q1695_013475 [Nippostrongylus brasiliensis]
MIGGEIASQPASNTREAGGTGEREERKKPSDNTKTPAERLSFILQHVSADTRQTHRLYGTPPATTTRLPDHGQHGEFQK